MKLRLRFTKMGKVRFTGHRDVARVLERTFRRVGLPVAYTEGFSPRMKVSFGLALPTCYQSLGEYVDVYLQGDHVDPGDDADSVGVVRGVGPGLGAVFPVVDMASMLSEALPPGFEVTAAVLMPRGGPSLQEVIGSCTWDFTVPTFHPEDPHLAVEEVLARSEIVAERKKKGRLVSEDIRAQVEDLSVAPADDGAESAGHIYTVRLSAQPRVVRPDELLVALAPGHEIGIVTRTHQWIHDDDGVREPVLPAGRVAPALEAAP